jgi:hypothetical protein
VKASQPGREEEMLMVDELADMEGPAVKRFVTAPLISSSMLTSEHCAVEQG